MELDNLQRWQHQHIFGNDQRRPGEWRTLIVVLVTVVMMVVEIVAGWWYKSMALLADGLHMASHAAALAVAVVAYVITRRHAHDRRYSFGTGKINSLGGYTGAVLLVLFALMMAWESVVRLIYPTEISFDQAIFVAFLGLLVNGVCAFILSGEESAVETPTDGHCQRGHAADAGTPKSNSHDHNRRAAFLHVVADALTSVLAIMALLSAKYFGWIWMDPLMGMIGAALVTHWSVGLLRDAGAVLLDRQGPASIETAIRHSIEVHPHCKVADLHLWAIGPGIYAVELVVVTPAPQPPDYYKALLPVDLGLVHVTVEVHQSQPGNKVDTSAVAGVTDSSTHRHCS